MMEQRELEERLKALERRVSLLERVLFDPIFPEQRDRFDSLMKEYGDILGELSEKFGHLREELKRLGWPR
jgi:uncharacterized coiled-coil protein SlyX